MQWLEVTLRVPREEGEAIAEVLRNYGYQGVSISHEGIPADRYDDDELPLPPQVAVRIYLPQDDKAETAKAEISTQLGDLGLAPIYTTFDEEQWADAWKQHYHPVRLGERIVVQPEWEPADDIRPNDVIITLDPGMAFGTGTHPTTRLCLASLDALVRPGYTVLDLGTGSGILAIAAAKLGASKVLAVDIDSVAVEVAQENIEKNGASEKIIVQEGGLESVVTSARRFDIVVANILARIIIAMADQHLGDIVRPGGIGIFSGIINDQVADVEAALTRAGLTLTGVRQEGDWVAMETIRTVE
jgi:ribosomal protein L11 methyltransferase